MEKAQTGKVIDSTISKLPTIEQALKTVYDPVEDIEESCEALGMTINELCLKAGVNPPTLYRWRSKPPKSFLALRRLLAAIEIEEQRKELERKAAEEAPVDTGDDLL